MEPYQNDFEVDLSLEDCSLDVAMAKKNKDREPFLLGRQKKDPFIVALEADANKLINDNKVKVLTTKEKNEIVRKLNVIQAQIQLYSINKGYTLYGREWKIPTHPFA
jgi:hypothetical protein